MAHVVWLDPAYLAEQAKQVTPTQLSGEPEVVCHKLRSQFGFADVSLEEVPGIGTMVTVDTSRDTTFGDGGVAGGCALLLVVSPFLGLGALALCRLFS